MAELGENHKRRILVAFQHMDDLLSQSMHVLARGQSGAQSRYIQDISASKVPRIEKHVQLIHDSMKAFLERFHIVPPKPSTTSSWALKTNLASIDIALEDLRPQKMKGYGEMDPAAARELTQTIQEIRKLVAQLHKTLE